MNPNRYILFFKKCFLLFLRIFGIVLACVALFFIGLNFLTSPSNDKKWNTDQAILPYAETRDNLITLRNIRNFSYTSTTDYSPAYYDKTFDIDTIKRAWFIVEPFSGIPGSAHTFLSFEFEHNEFVSISVEIRKEVGESFHPVKGLFNQYELMYVIGDENDLIKLRSNYRNDPVFLYPAKTTKEKAQKLFLSMISCVNELHRKPEFYNTIINNCTTNIAKHINSITPNKVPLLDMRLLLPENSDELAYELGLIDTDLSFADARKIFHINEKALMLAHDPLFSVKIREVKQKVSDLIL